MGEPGGSNVPSSMSESIAHEKGTRGTETSKYPEEKKSKEIARVAASESAKAQTHVCVNVQMLLHEVLWG